MSTANIVLLILAALLVCALIVTILGYYYKDSHNWQWTGIGEYKGNGNPEGRTVSFWMWVSVLIAPLVIGLGGAWFALIQQENELAVQQKQNDSALKIQENQAREEALQGYFDQIGELLLVYNLRYSESNSPERVLARARTLTVIRRLGPFTKGSIVKFLYESDLLKGPKPILELLLP